MPGYTCSIPITGLLNYPSMKKLFSALILLTSISSVAQSYNAIDAEGAAKIQSACISNIAPPGSKIRNNLFIFDVAKEFCLCISDSLYIEQHLLSGDLTPAKDHRTVQLSLQCKDSVLNKREPEALIRFNKGLAARNLPPVSRFPWHYWFD